MLAERGAPALAVLAAIAGLLLVEAWRRARQDLERKPREEALVLKTEERLGRAVSLDPGGYEARVFLGQLLSRTGRCEQALALFQEASHLLPHAEMPRRGAARCQRQLQARQANSDPL
ncbi:hypothetical protein JY651_27840 [Pyxidicoccus parkwayensis]|uniref:Tetratricopeptide repeat protein n=1 Tax=Pyxidicoccus parkwayensis TaxID=2813578 RepID=A0ABX7NJW4_9BACT|nr:hypothetical protein [Pyxidicoccus parkwaysis]QSQ19157.1 hypothetical protein JY651_27840 [Pyxidicoccus parkwaysis]